MSPYNKFNVFTRDALEAKHDFGSHTFHVMLSNTAPAAGDTVRADIDELVVGNGYLAGGLPVSISMVTLSGLTRVFGSTLEFNADGGPIGPFRYAILYNSSTVGEPLIAWFDYGGPLTLLDTQRFTVKFDAINGIFTLT
jgi:hypothetical protein